MEWSSPLKLSTSSIGTWCVHVVTQSCQALCDSMNWSPPASSVLAIAQAKILEWVAISSSRASSQPRNQTHIPLGSCLVGRFFITEPPMVCRSSMATPLLICPHCYCLPPPQICPRHTAFLAAFWIPQICFVLSLYSIFPSARNTLSSKGSNPKECRSVSVDTKEPAARTQHDVGNYPSSEKWSYSKKGYFISILAQLQSEPFRHNSNYQNLIAAKSRNAKHSIPRL